MGSIIAAIVLLSTSLGTAGASTGTGHEHLTGTLPSGATWVMDVPRDWNGTVLLYSHGYTPAGLPNPARNAPGDDVAAAALDDGYALIGSSYASTGWAVEDAVPDQLATLDTFIDRFGVPRRTIAWGRSYGGLVTTAIAERHPGRIDGSVSLCGLLQGGVANWNSTLDAAYALKTLLAPKTDVPLVGFTDAAEARSAATTLADALDQAQTTPRGRARIALAAALHNIPGYNAPGQSEPAPRDWWTQQRNQYLALGGLLNAATLWRYEAESRAGGNMSSNVGVDYTRMLARSPYATEVRALYRDAGLSLRQDLSALASAPRISADEHAVDYMRRYAGFTGELRDPQLDVHTTGDGLIPVQAMRAHRETVADAGASRLLRQAFVDRPGHCTFSAGEQLAALRALEIRLDTGRWGATTARAMNAHARAAAPGPAPAFVPYQPAPYPRPQPGQAPRPGVTGTR